MDTSSIALDDLIELETSTRLGKASGNGAKRTRKGSCPWCGGSDRFAVLVGDDPQHFYCGIHGGAGCGRHGDAIAFIEQWCGLKFSQAVQHLGLELPEYKGEYKPTQKKRVAKIEIDLDSVPGDVWTLAALSFARISQAMLWSEKGRPALAWLKQRGFTEETIKSRGYGYNPIEQFVELAEWGVTEGQKVWLPRGVVIPWMIEGVIWKISIRRGDADLKRDIAAGKKTQKYVSVKGGSNGLYRADEIQPGQPLFIFEGEFNADILSQSLSESGITDIAVVATGSTGKGRADNWLVKIAKASPVLFSFDPDGAGAQAVKDYWSKVFPLALSWPALGGDLNDMLLGKKDIAKWARKGLRVAGFCPAPEVIDVQPENIQNNSVECEKCGASTENENLQFHFTEEGNFLCSSCFSSYHHSHDSVNESDDSNLSLEQQAQNNPVSKEITRLFKVSDVEVFTSPEQVQAYKDRRIAEMRGEYINPHVEDVPILVMSPEIRKNRLGSAFYEELNRLPAPALFSHLAGGYEGYCHSFKRA